MSNPRLYIAIGSFLPLVGGAEKQAFLQGKSMRQRGFETTILTLRHDAQWPAYELIDGVPVVRVAGRLLRYRKKLPRLLQRACYALAMLTLGWRLWLHRGRYDVLHIYQVSLLALIAACVSRLASKPLIIAMRCTGVERHDRPYQANSLMAGRLDPTAPWLQIEEAIRTNGDLETLQRLGKPFVRLTRTVIERTQAVLVVLSPAMSSYLAERDMASNNMLLIPNGVDITRFSPPVSDRTGVRKAHVVICVARLRYQKGIDVLLHAWSLVQEQVPGAQLRIVGDGPLQPQLMHLAHALGLTNSVQFMGLQQNIIPQLHEAGIAVLPSRWEGMPNALLEAMACGLPCVATRVSGNKDLVQHHINGLLVEPEDVQELARALVYLLHNPVLARQYGQAARALVENNYTLASVMDSYAWLYKNLTTSTCQTPDIQEYALC